MKDNPSKADQVRALREARAAKSSDGGSRKLPFDPADAAGVKSGTVTNTGKQEGRTGIKVGASQMPGSSMSFGSDKSIAAEQALGPSEAKRGRPRIGEKRSKPWEECDPPMSRATYYRRQAEKKGKS